jgi:4-alpha-glucanotransferase
VKRKRGPAGGSWLDRRRSGLLLPLSALLTDEGEPVLSERATQVLRFLGNAGFTLWQMLPIHPPDDTGSPYRSNSAHAGDLRFVGAEPAAADGGGEIPGMRAFRAGNAAWLDDFALYCALKDKHHGKPWWQWPAALRNRDSGALGEFRRTHATEVNRHCRMQFLFFSRWKQFRHEARRNGILLMGDMPLFVSHDSADVWAGQSLFQLDNRGQPTVVAGVPPDYFSADGQRWGNPVYDWPKHAAQGFRWWVDRVRTELDLFDVIRIDHFRGLEAVWEIPASATSAKSGQWKPAPGRELLAALRAVHDPLPFLAEDLGIITPEVDALRREFNLPGMRVLQFAFDGNPANPYLPYNHEADSAVFTGTHDNNTTLGWFEELGPEARRHVLEYLHCPSESMPRPLVRAALGSVSRLAVIPAQDILGLGAASRTNTPGTATGNWTWRMPLERLTPELTGELNRLNRLYGRT